MAQLQHISKSKHQKRTRQTKRKETKKYRPMQCFLGRINNVFEYGELAFDNELRRYFLAVPFLAHLVAETFHPVEVCTKSATFLFADSDTDLALATSHGYDGVMLGHVLNPILVLRAGTKASRCVTPHCTKIPCAVHFARKRNIQMRKAIPAFPTVAEIDHCAQIQAEEKKERIRGVCARVLKALDSLQNFSAPYEEEEVPSSGLDHMHL